MSRRRLALLFGMGWLLLANSRPHQNSPGLRRQESSVLGEETNPHCTCVGRKLSESLLGLVWSSSLPDSMYLQGILQSHKE